MKWKPRAAFISYLLCLTGSWAFAQTRSGPNIVTPSHPPEARLKGIGDNQGDSFADHSTSDERRRTERIWRSRIEDSQRRGELLQKITGTEKRAGTETSGGGSLKKEKFYRPVGKALQALFKQKPFVYFNENEVLSLEMMTLALRAVDVLPVRHQLYNRLNEPVDLYNDPVKINISFNVPAWDNMSEFDKIKWGFHELMGILYFPDPAYQRSTQLATLAVQILKETQELGTPFYVHELNSGMSWPDILEFLEDNRQLGMLSSIINDCGKYVPDFSGFCLVVKTDHFGVPIENVMPIRLRPQ